MSWNDRIIEAAYTSPSGIRMVFGYEDVSQSITKRGTAFEFPDANGAYVQDLGVSGRTYPMRVFFWGKDYDLETKAFEALLIERGIGKLEHPAYGTIDVVPLGSITRRDDLKTGANQGVLEFTLFSTNGLIFPDASADPSSAVLNSVEKSNEESAQTFSDGITGASEVSKAELKNEYSNMLGKASAQLSPLVAINNDIKTQFNAILGSIESGIGGITSDPLAIAKQTIALVQLPSQLLGMLKAKQTKYENLINSILSSARSLNLNIFRSKDLYASSYISANILSTVSGNFTNKTEALKAADSILTIMSEYVEWRDNEFQSLDQVDTGESYQQLQSAVALVAGYLVEISFTLKQEYHIILERDRTIIDLCAELYGEIDTQLDFLINSNDLSGSEILELPKGREIVYYI